MDSATVQLVTRIATEVVRLIPIIVEAVTNNRSVEEQIELARKSIPKSATDDAQRLIDAAKNRVGG